MLNLLLDTYAEWITVSFPIIRIVIMCLLALLAVAIVIFIMIIPSNPDGGTNVISGTSDSFYSQNKSSNKEGRLKKVVTICAISIVVLTVLFFVSYLIFPAT